MANVHVTTMTGKTFEDARNKARTMRTTEQCDHLLGTVVIAEEVPGNPPQTPFVVGLFKNKMSLAWVTRDEVISRDLLKLADISGEFRERLRERETDENGDEWERIEGLIIPR